MQGNSVRIQKNIARTLGWEPDAVYDPNTGKSIPLDRGLVAPAAILSNQGVPMTKGNYPQAADGFDVTIGTGEPKADFNSPKRRSESLNAPFPRRGGDPNAGKGGM